MTRQLSPLQRLSAERSSALKALLALICVLFLAAQVQGLTHSHDGDVRYQADCDICLKLNSDDDTVSSDSDTATLIPHQFVPQYASADLVIGLVTFHQARAPPIT